MLPVDIYLVLPERNLQSPKCSSFSVLLTESFQIDCLRFLLLLVTCSFLCIKLYVCTHIFVTFSITGWLFTVTACTLVWSRIQNLLHQRNVARILNWSEYSELSGVCKIRRRNGKSGTDCYRWFWTRWCHESAASSRRGSWLQTL